MEEFQAAVSFFLGATTDPNFAGELKKLSDLLSILEDMLSSIATLKMLDEPLPSTAVKKPSTYGEAFRWPYSPNLKKSMYIPFTKGVLRNSDF